MTQVKICGLKTPDAMTAAMEGGADFIGLVFHDASPRNLEIEVASYLSSYVPERIQVCALLVDPDDKKLSTILSTVRVDMIQLHGNETPERVRAIKAGFGKKVMKAISISTPNDLEQIGLYAPHCDWLLLDAKGTSEMPGGTGHSFDWSLLEGVTIPVPWMLAGGLTPENVADAIHRLRPDAVDVSSGVESTRGVKDEGKIRAFLAAAKSA